MFSLRTLFVAIALFGFGIAAVTNQTGSWTSAFVTLTIALVIAAAALAVLRPSHRPFWSVVAIIGVAHTTVTYYSGFRDLHYQLITTRLTIKGWEWLHREERAKVAVDPTMVDPFGPRPKEFAAHLTGHAAFNGATAWYEDDIEKDELRNYYWSAQSLWTLVLAFGSGLLTSWLLPRQRIKAQANPTPQSPSSPA